MRSRSSSPETGGAGTSGQNTDKKKSSRPLFSKPATMTTTGKMLECLRTNVLTILNIMGVLGGVVLALILRNSREERWTQREIVYVGFIGNFVRDDPLCCHLIKLLAMNTYERRNKSWTCDSCAVQPQ